MSGHECYPTNERWPVCEGCGRRMDPSIEGDADRAWFKRQRERVETIRRAAQPDEAQR